jgi:hypothetical protein
MVGGRIERWVRDLVELMTASAISVWLCASFGSAASGLSQAGCTVHTRSWLMELGGFVVVAG